jgi:hypothetical protein
MKGGQPQLVPMGIVCEFELVSEAMPLTDIAADLDTFLHVEDVISGTDGPPAVVFSATEVDPERLEPRLKDCTSLGDYVRLESELSESQYRVVLEQTEVDTDVYRQLVDLRTHPTGATVTENGWKVRAQFADREDLATFQDACEETEVGFQLLRLSEGSGDSADDYGLTGPQHEAILVAFEMGYFEIPREATLSDVAEELDTTTSALSERLRRAHHTLIERTVRTTAP